MMRLENTLKRKLGGYRRILYLSEMWKRSRYLWVKVAKPSLYDNIYHCCTQKTASQWFRALLGDPVVYRYTGLKVLPYIQLGLRFATFGRPLPKRTFGIHLYISYPTYLSIPKPARYKTFFVLRDPRDIVTSWYFSALYSHVLIHPIPQLQKDLERLSLQDGLKYMIDRLESWGSFWTQESWMNLPEDQETARVFRYEDLTADEYSFLRSLFDYLDIVIPEEAFTALYNRHTFEKHANNRKRGVEDRYSHYRKGLSGDWKNYFDHSTMTYFRDVTKDLLEILEYPQ